MILLESPNMMLGNPVVNVERFCELVDVVGFSPQEVDDSSTVGTSSGPGENVPEQTFPGYFRTGPGHPHGPAVLNFIQPLPALRLGQTRRENELPLEDRSGLGQDYVQ